MADNQVQVSGSYFEDLGRGQVQQNRPKPGRPATGLAVLRAQATNQCAVFEGDVLRTELYVEAVHQRGDYQLIDLRAVVHSCPAEDAGDQTVAEKPVLDWQFVALAR